MIGRWEKRFENIRFLGWLALASLPFLILGLVTSDFLQIICVVAAVLLFFPAFIYIYVIVIWHWKDRYRGKHSDLWGALILIETSGWMKIVYLFRHIIPDMRHSGRYRLNPQQAGMEQNSHLVVSGE
jgi:hypothetical protein